MNWKVLAGALVGGGFVYVALALRAIPTSISFFEKTLTDPVPPARADISGSRLKTKYIAGADGSRLAIPDVLWDSELEMNCVFRKAADGSTRCLPPSIPGDNFGWGRVNYLDDSCTNGLVWVEPPPTGCATNVPQYAFRYTAPPYCSPAMTDLDAYAHVYAVGELLPPVSGPLYSLNDQGECVSQSSGPTNAIPYALGPEIPASSFAMGTPGTDP